MTKNNKKNLLFESDYFSIFDIALTLLKHLKLLLIFPSILCIWQIINVSFLIDPTFKSDARIMSSLSVQDGRQDISSIASQFGLNLGPVNNASKWPYPEILKSRTMAEIMLKRKNDEEEIKHTHSYAHRFAMDGIQYLTKQTYLIHALRKKSLQPVFRSFARLRDNGRMRVSRTTPTTV